MYAACSFLYYFTRKTNDNVEPEIDDRLSCDFLSFDDEISIEK
mgnify:CR=1 FL=1